MSTFMTTAMLVIAACLEVGGDALIRSALKHGSGLGPGIILILGGLTLFAYGIFVNSTPLDFGKALGIYVVIFFIIAQSTNILLFAARPDLPVLVGGAFIIVGGLVMSLWK